MPQFEEASELNYLRTSAGSLLNKVWFEFMKDLTWPHSPVLFIQNIVVLVHLSGVKYLSINTLKYYYSSFYGYLHLTIYIFGNFYFTTFHIWHGLSL